MLLSTTGESAWFPAARSAIMFVVDGLGAIQLRSHRGHARFLSQAGGKKQVARTVFPSTTAAALSTILTGAWPGQHGLVGYRVRDPEQDLLVNQLDGYEKDGLDPDTWQRSATIFEQAVRRGLTPYAVGMSKYRSTGLTRALMRGAEYVAEDDLAQRVRVAIALAEQSDGVFVYCYLPELDQTGHKYGVDSDRWRSTLESIDGALHAAGKLSNRVGAVVTSDHGMIDVPRTRHVLLQDSDPRLGGVRHIGGEPRMLHLYVEPGIDPRQVADSWRELSEGTAEVSTRDEAIAAGLFGDVADHVRGRIGDVLVAARGLWAFYDDRLEEKRAQLMIGQHGSTTPEETIVPLIRLGAYA